MEGLPEEKGQMVIERKKVGLIINPIAGMGGSVGLKGTDGPEILELAVKRGALPKAGLRAQKALSRLSPIKDKLSVWTLPGDMGEKAAMACGFTPKIIENPESFGPLCTTRGASALMEAGVDLILFAGGDGTARDICRAVKSRATVLGIPAGVKIHSAVFGINPLRTGELACEYLGGKTLETREAEVMDLDEERVRMGEVHARLYGYMKTPCARKHMQGLKTGSPVGDRESQARIANTLAGEMEKDTFYIIGPGTTTRSVMEVLGLEGTLLGVDLVRNRKLVAADTCEEEILSHTRGRKTKLIITPVGGQGILLGRGNQQVSPAVLKNTGRENIIVAATKSKLASMNGRPLLLDTGDEKTNLILGGYIRVITGQREFSMVRIGC